MDNCQGVALYTPILRDFLGNEDLIADDYLSSNMEGYVMGPHSGINHKKDQYRQLSVLNTDENGHELALECQDLRINLRRPIKEHKIIEKQDSLSPKQYKDEQLHDFTIFNNALSDYRDTEKPSPNNHIHCRLIEANIRNHKDREQCTIHTNNIKSHHSNGVLNARFLSSNPCENSEHHVDACDGYGKGLTVHKQWHSLGFVEKSDAGETSRNENLYKKDAQDDVSQCTDFCMDHCVILNLRVEQGRWSSVGKVLEKDVCLAHRNWAILEACKRANDSDIDHYILPHISDDRMDFALVELKRRCLWVSAGRLSERRRWKGEEILQSKRTATDHDNTQASNNNWQEENIDVSHFDCTIVLKTDEDMLARSVKPLERKENCEINGRNPVNSQSELKTNLEMCSDSMTASLNPEAHYRCLEDSQLLNGVVEKCEETNFNKTPLTVYPKYSEGFSVHDRPQDSIISQDENTNFGNTDCTIVRKKDEDMFARNVKPLKMEGTRKPFVPKVVKSHSDMKTNLKMIVMPMTESLNPKAGLHLEDCKLQNKTFAKYERTSFNDTLLTVCPKEFGGFNVHSEYSVLPFLPFKRKTSKKTRRFPESFEIPEQSKDIAWRKESFSKMKDPPTEIERYAKDGFYYDSNLMLIVCVHCRLQVENWKNMKSLGVYHLKNKCSFMLAQVEQRKAKSSETPTNASIHQQSQCSSENETNSESDGVTLSHESIATPEFTSIVHSELPTGSDAALKDYANLENIQAISISDFDSPTLPHSKKVPEAQNALLENEQKAPLSSFTIANIGTNKRNDHQPETLNQQENIACMVTEEQDSQQLVSLSTTKNYFPDYLDMTKAVSPDYCLVSARLATFVTWPGRGLPDKRCLVIAGFYFLGARDSVKCFFCGVTLKNWRAEDDVWETHARFRFSCDYVVAIKGDDFILRTMVKLANGGVIPADRQFITVAAEGNDKTTDNTSSSIMICTKPSNVRSSDESISNENTVMELASVSNLVSNQGTPTNLDTNTIVSMNNTTLSLGESPFKIDALPLEKNIRQTSTNDHDQTNCASSHFTIKNKAIENMNGTSDEACEGKPIYLQTDAEKLMDTYKLPADLYAQQPVVVARVEQRPTSVSTEHPISRHSSKLTGGQDLHARLQQLTDTNRRLRQQRTCRLCGQRGVDTIFLPCGHLCTCECCAATIRKCCLCSQRIRGTAHVFLE